MPRATPVFRPAFAGEGVERVGDILADPSYGRNPPHRGVPEGHPPVRSCLAAPGAAHSGEVAQAQEALLRSQKMEAMEQIADGAAHDFNTLLTPIVAALDRLQGAGPRGEREARLVAGAIQSTERARTLVQRLLAFARRQPL